MMNAEFSHNESLSAVLAERARAASDGRLILDVAAGLLVVLAVAIWRPRAWIVPCSIGIALAAYGAWGLVDREIAEREATADIRLVRTLRILRAVAAVAGLFAAAIGCLAVLGIGLGKWKS